MNTTDSTSSELLWKAADLVETALALLEGCADSTGMRAHWAAIRKLEAAWELLGSVDASEAVARQVDKTINAISLSLRPLRIILMQRNSMHFCSGAMANNDEHICIDEKRRLSEGQFLLESIGDWLENYGKKLRVRATKLGTVAFRMAKEAENCDPTNSTKAPPELDNLIDSARALLRAFMHLEATGEEFRVSLKEAKALLKLSRTTNENSRQKLIATKLLIPVGSGPQMKYYVSARGIEVAEYLKSTLWGTYSQGSA